MSPAPREPLNPPAKRKEMSRPPGRFTDTETGERLTREEAFVRMSARHFKAQMKRAKGTQ